MKSVLICSEKRERHIEKIQKLAVFGRSNDFLYNTRDDNRKDANQFCSSFGEWENGKVSKS